MRYDIAAEVAAYKAEVQAIKDRNAEKWRSFAEQIRQNDAHGKPTRKEVKV